MVDQALSREAFAAELRSLAHGSASFTRAFARYERVPDQVSSTLSPR